MNGSLIAIIVILVLCLVLAGIIYYTYCRIREKLRDTSRMLFGTDSMIEGMKQREAEVEMTPKSVSSATNLYMPSIMRDFPPSRIYHIYRSVLLPASLLRIRNRTCPDLLHHSCRSSLRPKA